MLRFIPVASLLILVSIINSPSLAAVSGKHRASADSAIKKGIAHLRTTQADDGSWSPKPGPAVTALIVAAMLDQSDIDRSDPTVAKGLKYILSKVQKDGSIQDGILANYNTSICLATLSRIHNDPTIEKVIENGRAFLKRTQYTSGKDESGDEISASHAFFGGFGYGKHGRPDGSNTQMTVEAFILTGSDCKDPEIVAAAQFFSRLQGIPQNKANGDKIENDGGAVYATSVNKDNIGIPQSMASPDVIDYVKKHGKLPGETKLRTYGSMTYAMFKTYIYAQLHNPKFNEQGENDPRVKEALKWISNNYTLEHNPGMPEAVKFQGYYYYLVTFARALDAYQHELIDTKQGKKNWAQDLITKLTSLQKANGSWTNEADRWLEGDDNLVTAYALTALTVARD